MNKQNNKITGKKKQNPRFSSEDIRINIHQRGKDLASASSKGLCLAQSPLLMMMLATQQWKLDRMRQRLLMGYHIKYVPFRAADAPEPTGAYTVMCPYSILRDAKQKEKASRGELETVVIGLFKTNIGQDGNPPRIRMQVARVATDNQKPWVSSPIDWNDTQFLSGPQKAMQTLSEFMEREFTYNSQQMQHLYQLSSLRAFHEATAADNERARAAYMLWKQTQDVMQDTPLRSSNIPRSQLPRVTKTPSVKSIRYQLETFTRDECADILKDRHGITPEYLKSVHLLDFSTMFTNPDAATSDELVAALKAVGRMLEASTPSPVVPA